MEDEQYLEDDASNVTPEEQAEYEQFVQNSFRLIYSEDQQVRPEILQALQAAQGGEANSAILALAQTTVTIVEQLDTSAREAGKPVSDAVLYHGGLAVVEELAEVAEAAQIHDYSEEDMTGAFSQAIDMYRPKLIESGRTSEDELKAGFAEIQQADEQGQMGQLLPGLGDMGAKNG